MFACMLHLLFDKQFYHISPCFLYTVEPTVPTQPASSSAAGPAVAVVVVLLVIAIVIVVAIVVVVLYLRRLV